MELHAERDYRLTLTDFDRYGRLHPASVLGLLQDISEVQVSEMGMGVDALAAEGYLWAVTRVRYEVAGDLSPHQAVTVRTWPHTLTRFSWLRDCSVRDGEGGLLVRATSEWVLVDARSRSPRSCSAASLRRARRSSGSLYCLDSWAKHGQTEPSEGNFGRLFWCLCNSVNTSFYGQIMGKNAWNYR